MKNYKIYVHSCPKCGREVFYKTKAGFNRAETQNILCERCRTIEKNLSENYTRLCPVCGCTITYKRKSDWQRANRANSKCLHCSDNKGKFKKGVKMTTSRSIPKWSLDNLLNGTLESYYWLGFILADGSFNKSGFEFSLKASDFQQIEKLCDFLNIDKSSIKFRSKVNAYRLCFQNKESINSIMNTFGIHYSKTYNPCDFSVFENLTDIELTALLIGIIDGDGHIDNRGKYITITAHKNWSTFYSSLVNKLKLNFNIHIRKRLAHDELIVISAGNKLVRKYFYDYLENQKLPVLKRKWNRLKI